MSDVSYAALRIACNRVKAMKNVEAIINDCSSFKIGKSGDSLYNRLNNYDGEYDQIDPVFCWIEVRC